MKNKRFTAKILIDIGMTICLLLLMPYSLLSETAHEWIGMAMLVLFISHHILNHKWVTSVRKGKYNAFRVIQTVLVIIMLILIMGSMISGILLSNHIFKWIKISGTYMTARQIHMFCAYWGLVVMSLHLGFHWNIAVAMAGRLWEHPSVIRTWAARSVATTIAGYGLYAFYRRQIGDYLIMRMHFVFYDYEKGIFPFLLDYLAVMILIAFIGYYSGVFLKKTGKRKIGVVILAMVIMVYIYFSKPGKDEKKNQQTINQVQTVQQKTDEKKENTEKNTSGDELENVTPGSEEYRGFLLDNVLHSPNEGDIHYNVYIPDAYDGTKEYALYVTLPGYQGLYFQGVGENIRTEDFGFEAQKYITDMIIVAPQLNDWGQTSADQTIELTQYFLTHYIINPSKVYINGYSGGGETLSLVLAKQPELYTAALMCSSQWDGAYEPVVEMKTPVYFVIGESDEYYGSEPFKEAYQQIHELYKEQGLSESEIDKLVVLDVKDKDYFEGTPVTYQHGGGYLFCRDKEIMGWLFNQ